MLTLFLFFWFICDIHEGSFDGRRGRVLCWLDLAAVKLLASKFGLLRERVSNSGVILIMHYPLSFFAASSCSQSNITEGHHVIYHIITCP